MPASGYNHKSTTYNKQYVTWKGTGVNSNPVGTASGHIRPLTNNDPGNNFSTGQRQLVSFARTIVHKPKVMILDEATSSNKCVVYCNGCFTKVMLSLSGSHDSSNKTLY